MSRVKTIARRTFLIGSAAIVGGVAFGTYLAKKPIPNPLLTDLPDGEAAITPYVKINADGITLITPRADKGQGSYSVQACLIAEELDIDPHTATLSPGLPGPAYFNSTILQEVAPFLPYDERAIAQNVRAFMSVPAKILQLQLTGGSSTVPDAFVKLRMAGAVARETLKQAAAEQYGVARADLKTENGQVLLPNGDSVAYTALAAAAAQIDPITDVTLRDPATWRILGKDSTTRLDMVAKCTGREVYGIDVAIEGMVHAAVRANPGIGGDATIGNMSAAKAMRGVQTVMPVAHGVAVIADNTWRAFQAVDAVEVEWGPAPYPGANSPEIFDALEQVIGDKDALDHRKRDEGDVDAALADEGLADGDLIEATYRLPYLAHAPMEPMNAVVQVTDDLCEIWTGTQIPLFMRDRAAKMTGLDKDQVLVHVQPMGGSFGHKLELTHVDQAVEIAMTVKGTPVKLTWSREEDMTHDYPRPAAVAKARGKVSGQQVDTFDLSVGQSALVPGWFGRVAGLSVPGPDATITTGSWDQPFDIPNYRVSGYRAPDMVPVSSWRSVGASGNGFVHDTFLDELIFAAGADPLAERIRLCMHDTSRKVLETVGEISGWDGPKISDTRARGVAFCMSFGVPCAQVIEVTNTPDGIKIDKVFAVVDVGTVLEPRNLEAQVFGGITFALSHAINCELTYENYTPQQDNYHMYEGLRMYQAPAFEIKALTNSVSIRGIGEPGVPPAAPALGNAIFAATGQRIREMPFNKHINFV